MGIDILAAYEQKKREDALDSRVPQAVKDVLDVLKINEREKCEYIKKLSQHCYTCKNLPKACGEFDIILDIAEIRIFCLGNKESCIYYKKQN